MKKIILILFFLTSCSTNNNIPMTNNNLSTEKLFDLSINQYKEFLNDYNKNNDFPKIDN